MAEATIQTLQLQPTNVRPRAVKAGAVAVAVDLALTGIDLCANHEACRPLLENHIKQTLAIGTLGLPIAAEVIRFTGLAQPRVPIQIEQPDSDPPPGGPERPPNLGLPLLGLGGLIASQIVGPGNIFQPAARVTSRLQGKLLPGTKLFDREQRGKDEPPIVVRELPKIEAEFQRNVDKNVNRSFVMGDPAVILRMPQSPVVYCPPSIKPDDIVPSHCQQADLIRRIDAVKPKRSNFLRTEVASDSSNSSGVGSSPGSQSNDPGGPSGYSKDNLTEGADSDRWIGKVRVALGRFVVNSEFDRKVIARGYYQAEARETTKLLIGSTDGNGFNEKHSQKLPLTGNFVAQIPPQLVSHLEAIYTTPVTVEGLRTNPAKQGQLPEIDFIEVLVNTNPTASRKVTETVAYSLERDESGQARWWHARRNVLFGGNAAGGNGVSSAFAVQANHSPIPYSGDLGRPQSSMPPEIVVLSRVPNIDQIVTTPGFEGYLRTVVRPSASEKVGGEVVENFTGTEQTHYASGKALPKGAELLAFKIGPDSQVARTAWPLPVQPGAKIEFVIPNISGAVPIKLPTIMDERLKTMLAQGRGYQVMDCVTLIQAAYGHSINPGDLEKDRIKVLPLADPNDLRPGQSIMIHSQDPRSSRPSSDVYLHFALYLGDGKFLSIWATNGPLIVTSLDTLLKAGDGKNVVVLEPKEGLN